MVRGLRQLVGADRLCERMDGPDGQTLLADIRLGRIDGRSKQAVGANISSLAQL